MSLIPAVHATRTVIALIPSKEVLQETSMKMSIIKTYIAHFLRVFSVQSLIACNILQQRLLI